MPAGGRLKIDLDTASLDGGFVAEHPGVRPGGHVLITVTEERDPSAEETAPATSAAESGARPGVDVGVLVRLVGEAGGHVWMTAEPTGTMVLKIHLPQDLRDIAMTPQAAAPSDSGHTRLRWFGRAN
jgi:hypothetical protein